MSKGKTGPAPMRLEKSKKAQKWLWVEITAAKKRHQKVRNSGLLQRQQSVAGKVVVIPPRVQSVDSDKKEKLD